MASIHAGHRQRAKEEFLARGLNGMADHRVLELLLFYAIPQGDVNELAHRLVERFENLSGVLTAPREELLKVKGVSEHTATLLQLILPVAARHIADRGAQNDIYDSPWAFQELLMPLFLGARNEKSYLVCLDGKNKLLACRELGEGIVDAVNITARKVMEVALSCNAARAVLAHNHISGVALYSQTDIDATRAVARLLAQVDVELIDHFVVTEDDMVSMRESGVFDHI